MSRLTVLLTVHNRKAKTLACLRNLFRQNSISDVQIDVYLTDDGCTDGTPEAIQSEFPQVHIVKGDGSLFWNRGMYEAWREAEKGNYDYYMWLNDDTFLTSDAISRLYEESKKHNDKAIIVGSTISSNSDDVTYGGRTKSGKLLDNIETATTCDTFNGNIVLIPKYAYQIIGKNDPIFLHGIGDFDYGLRATKAGIKNVVAKGIFGICDLHENLPTWCDPKKTFKIRWKNFFSPLGANPYNFFIYKHRHFGIIPACIVFCSNFLHVLIPSIWDKKTN